MTIKHRRGPYSPDQALTDDVIRRIESHLEHIPEKYREDLELLLVEHELFRATIQIILQAKDAQALTNDRELNILDRMSTIVRWAEWCRQYMDGEVVDAKAT